MSVKLSTGLRLQMLNSIRGAVTTTASLEHGIIYIYSGSQPATADAAVTGSLLLKITVSSGAFTFGVATNGLDFDAASVYTLSKAAAEVWSGIGLGNGTAGWGRFMGNATDDLGISTVLPRLDFPVATAGTNVMVLSSTAIVTGATTTVDSFNITWSATV